MSDLQEQSLVVVQLYDEFSRHHHIASEIRQMLLGWGMVEGVDYDIVAGFVDDPQLTMPTDAASSKQLWFLNKCIQDARPFAPESDLLAATISIALQELRAPLSKQRASQLIDALKEQTQEARLGS